MLPTTPVRGAMKRKNFANETPRTGKTSRILDNPSSPVAMASPSRTPHKPSSAAPLEAITPFRQRNNAGETIEVLNPQISKPTLPLDGAIWNSRVNFMFNMEIKHFSYRPMYQKLSEASETQDERIDEFAMAIQEHYSLPDDAFGDPSIASPTEIVAVGRIVSDSLEGKFNPSSILLESSRMMGGMRTPLQLLEVSSFAFFPGQILAVKGVNSSGRYFQVHEILEPPKLPPASTPVSVLAAHAKRLDAGPVSVFIASGPYTSNDNLDFEALEELCAKCAEQQPDAVILTGPFIDSAHPLVQTGDFDLEDGNEDGTIEDLFRQKISRKLQQIQNSMIFLIPSLRDAVSKHTAFPQEGLKRKFLDLPPVRPPLSPAPTRLANKNPASKMSPQSIHVLPQRASLRRNNKRHSLPPAMRRDHTETCHKQPVLPPLLAPPNTAQLLPSLPSAPT